MQRLKEIVKDEIKEIEEYRLSKASIVVRRISRYTKRHKRDREN